MAVMPGGWVTAGECPDHGLQVKNSALGDRVVITDVGRGSRLSYMSCGSWRLWLSSVAAGTYKPEVDDVTGDLGGIRGRSPPGNLRRPSPSRAS